MSEKPSPSYVWPDSEGYWWLWDAGGMKMREIGKFLTKDEAEKALKKARE